MIAPPYKDDGYPAYPWIEPTPEQKAMREAFVKSCAENMRRTLEENVYRVLTNVQRS